MGLTTHIGRHVGAGARISPHALIGSPPEHRDHRDRHTAWQTDYDDLFPVVGADALIEGFVTVDSGTYQPTTVGPRSYLMKGVHVGHDSVIGVGCKLAPHACLGGSTWVDDFAYIGMGATVRPFTSVGRHSIIAQGAAVVNHVPPYECWGGVPARKLFALCYSCGTRIVEADDTDYPFPIDPQPSPPPLWKAKLHVPHDFTARGVRCSACATTIR